MRSLLLLTLLAAQVPQPVPLPDPHPDPLPDSQPDPPHMVWADRLIRDLQPAHNRYGSQPTVVVWRGVEGAAISRNRSVCSTFITRLLRQAYGYTAREMRAWFGAASPTARQVHQAILQGRRFQRIPSIVGLRRGDLIAIDYRRQSAPEAGAERATGHLMLVAAPPQWRGDPQVGVRVIDSSRSGHGPGDTRIRPDGSWGAGGVGEGTIGLQVDGDGRIQAYRWSLSPRSRLWSQRQHSLVVGRLCPPDRCPLAAAGSIKGGLTKGGLTGWRPDRSPSPGSGAASSPSP